MGLPSLSVSVRKHFESFESFVIQSGDLIREGHHRCGRRRGIGLETVKAALKAGHSVRALARSARRIPVDHPKLEKMAGDALEMATVKRALTGIDVVIQSLGVSAGPEIIFKPTRFFSTATRVLVTAMEEGQVKRLISVTGFGAGDSRGRGGFLYNATFHLLLGRVYDDKDV